jgi:hypothetical protein
MWVEFELMIELQKRFENQIEGEDFLDLHDFI